MSSASEGIDDGIGSVSIVRSVCMGMVSRRSEGLGRMSVVPSSSVGMGKMSTVSSAFKDVGVGGVA